jgi:hypothetical protein
VSEWIYNLPVVWMAVVVFAATYVVTGCLYALVIVAAKRERVARAFKAMSPGMLPPLGIIFGLLVAFLAAQVWSDFDRAQAAVSREASALRAVVMLVDSFPGEPEARMKSLIRRQIDEAVTQEWPAMSQHRATLNMVPVALWQAMQLALSLDSRTPGQIAAQREIVVALENALDARRQRIIVSESAVNWVKWTSAVLQGLFALLAIAIVHCDNRIAAAIALGIFATGIAVSIVLIASHSGPFSGQISVGPDLLLQVMPPQNP